MPQLFGTNQTYDLAGLAEDVEDVIFNISPTDTPLLTMAKRKKATATNHQWQTDTLDSAATNAQIEGDDGTFATVTPTTVLSNRLQIFTKRVMVSGTADAVRKYGRDEEFAYQIAKRGKEIKRDIEFAMVRNQSSSAGSDNVPRMMGGLESTIATLTARGNAVKGALSNTTTTTLGYSGGDWVAPVDGTASTLTEADVLTALQLAWEDGGDPRIIMASAVQKRKFAAFAGASSYAGTYNSQKGKNQGVVVGAVDVYISDFGEHSVVLNRYQRDAAIFCVDPDYVSVAFLRPIKYEKLAKTGDAEKGQLIAECTLVVDNPNAHAKLQSFTA